MTSPDDKLFEILCEIMNRRYYICSTFKSISFMEETKKSRGIFWLLTFVSVVGMVLLLMFHPEWVWVSFPFVGVFFASAMDAI